MTKREIAKQCKHLSTEVGKMMREDTMRPTAEPLHLDVARLWACVLSLSVSLDNLADAVLADEGRP